MRQVRILVSLAGPEYALRPGECHSFPDAEASRLIAAGIAAPLAKEKPVEAAVAPEPEPEVEKAVARRQPRKRRKK